MTPDTALAQTEVALTKVAEIVVATTMPSAGVLAALQTYATTTAQGTGYGAV